MRLKILEIAAIVLFSSYIQIFKNIFFMKLKQKHAFFCFFSRIFIQSNIANCQSQTWAHVIPTFPTPQMSTEEECVSDFAGFGVILTVQCWILQKFQKPYVGIKTKLLFFEEWGSKTKRNNLQHRKKMDLHKIFLVFHLFFPVFWYISL